MFRSISVDCRSSTSIFAPVSAHPCAWLQQYIRVCSCLVITWPLDDCTILLQQYIHVCFCNCTFLYMGVIVHPCIMLQEYIHALSVHGYPCELLYHHVHMHGYSRTSVCISVLVIQVQCYKQVLLSSKSMLNSVRPPCRALKVQPFFLPYCSFHVKHVLVHPEHCFTPESVFPAVLAQMCVELYKYVHLLCCKRTSVYLQQQYISFCQDAIVQCFNTTLEYAAVLVHSYAAMYQQALMCFCLVLPCVLMLFFQIR